MNYGLYQRNCKINKSEFNHINVRSVESRISAAPDSVYLKLPEFALQCKPFGKHGT